MASIQASKAIPVAQVAYAASSITSTYTVAGTFTKPLVWAMIMSTLDQPVQISFDGVADHIAVPAGSTVPVFIPIDFKAFLTVLPNPIIAVKEIGNPTTGSLYICGFSADMP